MRARSCRWHLDDRKTRSLPSNDAATTRLEEKSVVTYRHELETRDFCWIAVVFALAFLLRFLPVLFWPTMSQPDEIFQSVEQGHRLVFGYGLVPWEFEHGARSWLLGYVCAGLIRLSLLFGDNPANYLRVIGAAFSLLSASGSVCAFLWAKRLFGTALGLVAAMVPLCWVDGIFYGARALSDTVAPGLLVIGLYLAFPGQPVHGRVRLALAGALLAASVIFRLTLAPCVALACFWGDRQTWKHRVSWLTLGALLCVALDGWFDAMTWGLPFEPLWRNFTFNILKQGADAFGTGPWWWYLYDYAGAWGGTLPIFFGLAIIGARWLPLPFLMGLTLCIVHSFLAHKETRFLFPAINLFAICAGVGMVQLGLWINDALEKTRRRPRRLVFGGLCAAWLILSGINVFGLDYREYWDEDQHDALQISDLLYHGPPRCGLGLYNMDGFRIGGYSYFHRRLPIYPVSSASSAVQLRDAAGNFDAVVIDLQYWQQPARQLLSLGYQKDNCVGKLCILRRAGDCRGDPMPKPPGPKNFALGPAAYPQHQGVND